MADIDQEIFLDFSEQQSLTDLMLNDTSLTDKIDTLRRGIHINLPKDLLDLGENIVSASFGGEYSRDGCGIHSYID